MIGMAGSIGASRCEASQSSRISKRIFFSISVSPILTFIAAPSAVSSRIIGALASRFASRTTGLAGSEFQTHSTSNPNGRGGEGKPADLLFRWLFWLGLEKSALEIVPQFDLGTVAVHDRRLL